MCSWCGTPAAEGVDYCLDCIPTENLHREREGLPPISDNAHRVPSKGARRRVMALRAIGHRPAALGRMAGINIRPVMNECRHSIPYELFVAVAALYEELKDTPGPSEIHRVRAAEAGIWTPADWEGVCIDTYDPNPVSARLTKQPFRDRETCANGHPWKPETTRWRRRNRGGRHGTAPERDCLVCKDKSEGRRRKRRAIERRWM